MRRKSILMILVLVLGFTLSVTLNGLKEESYVTVNASSDTEFSDAVSAQSDDTAVTMRDIEIFLKDKSEHYPLSDEFIERYQQTSGGYINNAKKAGLVVDKQKHEPNQKWHFFDSWLYPSIEDGTLTWDADAKKRVYTNLQCPELLLWIYEAAGVNPSKVKLAKDAAEKGKAEGKSTASIAKDMRLFVPWDDIANAVKGFVPTPSVTLSSSKVTLNVGEQSVITATLHNASDAEAASWTVVEGIEFVEITPNANEVTVNAIANGVAKIKVSYSENLSAECVVTVKDNSVAPPVVEGTIKYNLSGTSTAQVKTVEAAFEVFKLVGESDGVITSVSAIEYIYGGGSGGSGESRWSSTDMIKIGTGSNNGSITIDLNVEVSGIIITGYVHDNKCAIRVGDSASADWTDEENDNKTTMVTCSDMTVVDKSAVDEGRTSTITIEFERTSSLTIATVNSTSKKYPLYITSIEFIVAGAEQ